MLLSKVQRERLEEDTKFVLISETASDNSKPLNEPQIQPLRTVDEGEEQTVGVSHVIEMRDHSSIGQI